MPLTKHVESRLLSLLRAYKYPALSASTSYPTRYIKQPRAFVRRLEAARRFGFPTERLIFEITANEELVDKEHLKSIIREYRLKGFKTAIDDFGARYAGLNLLAEFQPDIIKLDMTLVRSICTDPVRQAIVQGILGVCKALNIEVIAEGVETNTELQKLLALGINYYQGYLFAKPEYESLPNVKWPPLNVD